MSGIVLGIDVGLRRVGVASASLIARLPSPLTTIDREKADAIDEITRLVSTEGAETVVVGLPRGLDGQETGQTAITRQFAADLTAKLDVPVVMQDEAGTSVEAEARLKRRGQGYTKADIDAEAAVLILDDYLNTVTERTA